MMSKNYRFIKDLGYGERWAFDCDICGDEVQTLGNPSEDRWPIQLKTGWFSFKRFDFCKECITSLNMKYGCVDLRKYDGDRREVDEKLVLYGYDTFLLSACNKKGCRDYCERHQGSEISPAWYGRSIDKIMIGDIVNDLKNYDKFKEEVLRLTKERNKKFDDIDKKDKENAEKVLKEKNRKKEALKNSIINLLKEKAIKMPASDIDAYLKYQDVDKIKEVCEEMYQDGEISYAGNGRYFILTEEQEKPKKTSAAKSEEVDVEKELEKYKGLLDKGLITQEEYDAKRKQILGL